MHFGFAYNIRAVFGVSKHSFTLPKHFQKALTLGMTGQAANTKKLEISFTSFFLNLFNGYILCYPLGKVPIYEVQL